MVTCPKSSYNGIEDSNKVISFGVSSTKDAETVVTNDSARDGYERGEDVTIGRYTWKTVNFTWHKTPSMHLATDIPNSGRSVEITLFMATPDDPAVKAFLESIESAKKISKKRSLRPRTLASRTSARRMDLLSPERESSVTSNMTPHAE